MPVNAGLRVKRAALLLRRAAAGSDTTPPDFTSGEEGDVTNATVAILFSEAIEAAGDDFESGVTIEINAAGATIDSATLQGDSRTVYYVLSAAADANDEITFAYSDAGGVIADEAGNQLDDVAETAVTNNVGTHLWFDNDADSAHALVTLRL